MISTLILSRSLLGEGHTVPFLKGKRHGATPYDALVCFPLGVIDLGSRANLPR
jgi:hypothetical protein